MKLTMRIGAAMSIAALAACSQSGQDNTAGADRNAEMMANETVLPPDENTAGSDTLGNQLDQLNESGQENMSNEADNSANSE